MGMSIIQEMMPYLHGYDFPQDSQATNKFMYGCQGGIGFTLKLLAIPHKGTLYVFYKRIIMHSNGHSSA